MIVFAVVLCAPVGARESTRQSAGGTFNAYSSLLLPAGVIASGRTLAVDDAGRMHLGPSAIRTNRGTAVSMTYAQPYRELDGLDVGSIDATISALPLANMGFSYGQVRVSGIREASGGALTGRTFDAALGAARLMGSTKGSGRFGFGAGLDIYTVDIRGASRTRVGLELGGDVAFDSARLLLNVRGLGADRGDADRLPIFGELVAEWSPYSHLKLGGAVSYEEDGYGDFRAGASYDAFEMLTLVAGYVHEQRAWSAGAVFRYQNMNLQYSVLAHRELDMTHTVTLGVKF